jgi:hypothetical protein
MQAYLLGVLLSWTTAAASVWLNPKPVIWIPYGIINPLIFSLPRLARAFIPAVRARVSATWVRTIEWVAVLIILVNAPGSLVLHDLGVQYDRFLHFVCGVLILLLAVPIISAVRGPGASASKTLWVSVALVFVGLFGFEAFQYSSDRIFGTQLFHDQVQSIERDVTEDILFGTAGLALSAMILRRSKRAWKRFAVDGIQGQENR